MKSSREMDSSHAAFITRDSPDNTEEDPRHFRPALLTQESCDFGFIEPQQSQQQCKSQQVDQRQGNGSSNSELGELVVPHTVSAASLNFRASTVLTEKIITEISDSIRVFKPSRSLHELLSDRQEEEEDPTVPTATIDLVVSGGGLKGYFVCGCISVLQRQLDNHNIHIARVAGASAGAWSAFFVCTGITTAMWMESYYKCYDNLHR